MKKDVLDREVKGMLASPLVRQIIAELNPDMGKLRKAIRAALVETGFGGGPEYLDLPLEEPGTFLEKVAVANALRIPFKKLWPITYQEVSLSIRSMRKEQNHEKSGTVTGQVQAFIKKNKDNK